ncbi:carbamoyl phosphate synthase-like protein [Anaerohalosphaera lusitana]|uniref:Carbamoyl phosphate synthase-like protein n=1 Tax=Anaerohalosphaera lusitana TaxID=1936003 RepID=A0A1U9NRV4_9BACT|nr:ATP-grasp domain-containing protein [Anaerohalosphaera lusitana]AQT70330.1 carbamoyl phosphate synthase-like protein [Anaerohalosphaera lusitana]
MAESGIYPILFTCVGRRVSLIERFRACVQELGQEPCIIGADMTQMSPALQMCDKKFLVSRVDESPYLEELLKIVRDNGVRLLVPTVDLDLRLLAENRDLFAKAGCFVLISKPEVIDICQDKQKTYRFLHENGIDTPMTWSSEEALEDDNGLAFPCFLKPRDGYASRGSGKVNSRLELEAFTHRIPNCIVQEYIRGNEFTCDVYMDMKGKARCVVPRMRIEVRSGEVSKGKVVKDRHIMDTAANVVEKLGAGPGVITLQLIRSFEGRIAVIEVNPRFGGGVPLAIKAGADFPMWILKELRGEEPEIEFGGFKDGLVMLRYDAEVWLET